MIEYLNSIIPYFYIGLGTRPIDTFGMIALVLSVPLGAFLWPLRYGMLEDEINHSLTKISWTVRLRKMVVSVLMSLPTIIITQNLSFIALAIAMYSIVPSQWLQTSDDVGRIHGTTFSDLRTLFIKGALVGVQVGIVIFLLGLTLTELAWCIGWFAIATPLSYVVGWRIFEKLGSLSKYLVDGRQYGRAILGAAIALGFGVIISL